MYIKCLQNIIKVPKDQLQCFDHILQKDDLCLVTSMHWVLQLCTIAPSIETGSVCVWKDSLTADPFVLSRPSIQLIISQQDITVSQCSACPHYNRIEKPTKLACDGHSHRVFPDMLLEASCAAPVAAVAAGAMVDECMVEAPFEEEAVAVEGARCSAERW